MARVSLVSIYMFVWWCLVVCFEPGYLFLWMLLPETREFHVQLCFSSRVDFKSLGNLMYFFTSKAMTFLMVSLCV